MLNAGMSDSAFLLGVAVGALVASAGFVMLRPSSRACRRLMFKTKVCRSFSFVNLRHVSSLERSCVQVKKAMLEKYVRHHRGVWPEVEIGLRRHGESTCSLAALLVVLPLLRHRDC